MNFLSLIESKRDGGKHSSEELGGIVRELVAGNLPDYQIGAWLMAVYFKGMDREELTALTMGMRDSGERLEFPDDPRPIVDKHSTGGVGDKVSLPLAPLLAALGFRVPMISGRALGITGGTLDKLESIPGLRTNLSREQIIQQVQEIGVAIAGQTERMVPADRILYAMRDVTGTVPSLPLITASILSKKLAESLQALVLDVKFGKAAFMKSREDAELLGRTMTELASDCGVASRYLLSDMNQPLGNAVGNWLEVRESVDCLKGKGPPDLRRLVVDCAAHLLEMTGKVSGLEDAARIAANVLDSGQALARWEMLLSAQGADMDAYRRKLELAAPAGVIRPLLAETDLRIECINALIIGESLRRLGAGRLRQSDHIRPGIGVILPGTAGEMLSKGGVLAEVHAETEVEAKILCSELRRAFETVPCA